MIFFILALHALVNRLFRVACRWNRQLVLTDPDGERAREQIGNLVDMCGYFLQLGDYDQVLKLPRQAADSRLVRNFLQRMSRLKKL